MPSLEQHCVPLGTSPPHTGHGGHSRDPKFTQPLNKGRAGSAHKPRLLPVLKQSPGEAAKLSPTAEQSARAKPSLQCHLWGAAHCSASCTVPGEPGSSSVPTSHPAPSHSTAGRAGAEQRNTRHCWAWQPDVYLSWQSTLCPTRSPNPNVGRTPRGCQKQQEAPNVPVLRWPARDSSSSSAHQSPELVLGSGGQTPPAAAAGETGNVCRKC